jgi:hypothetical protein
VVTDAAVILVGGDPEPIALKVTGFPLMPGPDTVAVRVF